MCVITDLPFAIMRNKIATNTSSSTTTQRKHNNSNCNNDNHSERSAGRAVAHAWSLEFVRAQVSLRGMERRVDVGVLMYR